MTYTQYIDHQHNKYMASQSVSDLDLAVALPEAVAVIGERTSLEIIESLILGFQGLQRTLKGINLR